MLIIEKVDKIYFFKKMRRKKLQTKIVKIRQAKKCYPVINKAKTFIYTAESVTPLIVAGKTPKIK